MPLRFAVGLVLLCLTACTAPEIEAPDTTVRDALAGKTLVNEDASFFLDPDGTARGTLNGEVYEGTWSVARGKFCGSATKPERFAGISLCQSIELADASTAILTGNGRRTVFAIQ